MVTAGDDTFYLQHVHFEVPCRTKQLHELKPDEPPLPPERSGIRGWLEAEGQLIVAGDVGRVVA